LGERVTPVPGGFPWDAVPVSVLPLDFIEAPVIYRITRSFIEKVIDMRRALFPRIRGVLFVMAVAAVTTALPHRVLSQEEATVRVLNINTLGFRVELTDERLVELARDTSDMPSRQYPELEGLTFSGGDGETAYVPGASLFVGLVDVAGALDTDGGFNFTSVSNGDLPGKCDLAIVGFDGSVRRFDDEVIIEYNDRTVSTAMPVLVLPGDVMFLFVRETKEMYTEEEIPPQGCG
jgi:hypothetical protein